MTTATPGVVVVGLVGRIGSGKSTVAGALAKLGAEVLDADAIAHEVLAEPAVRAGVASRFGTGVLRNDGGIDRRVLASIVFGEGDGAARALSDLESLVHPRVRARIEATLERLRAAAARGAGRRTVVVLDVPLLMQSGWDMLCDRIVLVECDEAVRLRRLADRGWTVAHRDRRDAAWARGYRPPPPGKTSPVDASGDVAYIHRQIESLWPILS